MAHKNLILELEEQVKVLHTTSLDISFNELKSMFEEKELNISPAYQRLFRWSEADQSRFIESLLLEMPIPPIFVIETDDKKWELIDGLQRISSYLRLRGIKMGLQEDDDGGRNGVENDFLELVDCDIVESLNGHTFETLPIALQIRLKRSFIRVEVLRYGSDKHLKYHLFKRLNSGGEMLAPQEMRNCTIRILDDRFIEFIKVLAENTDFKDTIINLSDFKKQSAYTEELVLRFLAFKNNREAYKHDVDSFLTEYLEAVTLESENDFNYNSEQVNFEKTFKILNELHGSKIFGRVSNNKIIEAFAIYHFEAISLGIQSCINKIDMDNNEAKANLKNKLKEIKLDSEFNKLVTGGGKNSKGGLNARIDFVDKKLGDIFS
jgi:uncharacterized protein DUF262